MSVPRQGDEIQRNWIPRLIVIATAGIILLGGIIALANVVFFLWYGVGEAFGVYVSYFSKKVGAGLPPRWAWALPGLVVGGQMVNAVVCPIATYRLSRLRQNGRTTAVFVCVFNLVLFMLLDVLLWALDGGATGAKYPTRFIGPNIVLILMLIGLHRKSVRQLFVRGGADGVQTAPQY